MDRDLNCYIFNHKFVVYCLNAAELIYDRFHWMQRTVWVVRYIRVNTSPCIIHKGKEGASDSKIYERKVCFYNFISFPGPLGHQPTTNTDQLQSHRGIDTFMAFAIFYG